jgi:dTDP-4-dehydrorhamnose reductase
MSVTQSLEEASSHAPNAAWFSIAINQKPLITRRLIPITTDEDPTPARRPAYSVLSNARLTRTFGLRLPDWQMQLRSLFDDDPSSLPSNE